MNHELIMLREAKRVGKLAQSLQKEVKYRAIKSYASATVKDGTMGQIEELGRLITLRDECLLFCRALAQALKSLDKEHRAVLNAYYFKGIGVGAIADRLKITYNNVYSKLFVARLSLRKALNRLGYDERWLTDNYSHLDFINERFKPTVKRK